MNHNLLVKYILENRKMGRSDADIKEKLYNAGWNEDQIAKAFKELSLRKKLKIEILNLILDLKQTILENKILIKEHLFITVLIHLLAYSIFLLPSPTEEFAFILQNLQDKLQPFLFYFIYAPTPLTFVVDVFAFPLALFIWIIVSLKLFINLKIFRLSRLKRSFFILSSYFIIVPILFLIFRIVVYLVQYYYYVKFLLLFG